MTKNYKALSISDLVIILCSLFIGPFIYYAPISPFNPILDTIVLAALSCVAISVYRIARLYPVDPFFSSVKEWAGIQWARLNATCANGALSVMILSFTWYAAHNIISLFFDKTLGKYINYFQTDFFLASVIMLLVLLICTSDNKKFTRFSQYVFLSITIISVLLTAIVCFKDHTVSHLVQFKIAEGIRHYWIVLVGMPLLISSAVATGLFIFAAPGLLLASSELSKTAQKKAMLIAALIIIGIYLTFTLAMLYAPQIDLSLEGTLEEIIRLRQHVLSWLMPVITIGKITGILGLTQALIYATESIAPSLVGTIKKLWSHGSELPWAIVYVFAAAAAFSFIHPWVAHLPLFLLFSTTVATGCFTLFIKKHNTNFFESFTAAVGLITSILICGVSTYKLLAIVYTALLAFVLWPSGETVAHS